MKQLELIVILFAIVLYLWWRVRRRMAEVKARFRSERKTAEGDGRKPGALTLEKDPVTGVYRPPKS
jgi:hypothetical protein